MRITNVEAFWLRCPIPKEKQHFSDYGLLTNFDMTLVVITTDSGGKGCRGFFRFLCEYR